MIGEKDHLIFTAIQIEKRPTYIVKPTLAKFKGKLPEMELKETSLRQN